MSVPQKDEGAPWLPEKAVATEWLGLFYSTPDVWTH
jgi:hypothetical protein